MSDKRFNETRRIVRHLKKEALQSEQEPEEEPPPPLRPEKPTITVYGDITHVNFHSCWVDGTFVKKDPVTKKTKRVARRFDRSDVFYTEDGKLLD